MNSSRSSSPTDQELDQQVAELTAKLLKIQQHNRNQQAEVENDDKEIAQMKTNIKTVLEGCRSFMKAESYQALLKRFPQVDWTGTSYLCHL